MVSTHLNNISQFGSSPQIGMKIKYFSCHHHENSSKFHHPSWVLHAFFKALWRGMMSQTPTYPASFPRKAFWKACANLKQNLSSVLVGQNENHIGSTPPPPNPQKGSSQTGSRNASSTILSVVKVVILDSSTCLPYIFLHPFI